jgi:uncharacterized membrane protein
MAKRKSKPEEAPDEEVLTEVSGEEALAEEEAEVPAEAAEPEAPDEEEAEAPAQESDAAQAVAPEAPAEETVEPAPLPARVKVRYSEKADHPGLLAGRQVQPGEVHVVAYGAYLRAKQANPAHYELVEEVGDGGQ